MKRHRHHRHLDFSGPALRALPIGMVASLLAVDFAPATDAADELTETSSVEVVELRVSPATIELGGSNRRQQLLVTAVTRDGRELDVTRTCNIIPADPKIARLEADGVLAAVSDGRTELAFRSGTAKLRMPVEVKQAGSFPPIHFRNDIVPIFSKLGCNSGGCHGKQGGQNGFELSVFGYDARADFDALVKEARGRRLFPGAASNSLLLQKVTGRLAHGGGRRTELGSPDDVLLTEWVRQGMPWGDASAPVLTEILVEPSERILAMQSEQQALVTAVYSDGSRRDVTHAASYSSNADRVADVAPGGLIHTGNVPGEAAITVNYMGQVGVVRVLVPRPGGSQPYPKLRVNNRIDALVWSKLEKMQIVPSELCDDATFLRRLFVDTIGTLPEPDEVCAFLADDKPRKRQRAIESVLARREFADYWALKWADVLLIDRQKLGERGAFAFHGWLREQFARNRPYDEWARELITATGSSGRIGPVNFYRALRTPEELTRAVSQSFLGVRLDCAQCHHHPFEKWGQEDFYGMAGFFNGIERKKLAADRELVFHGGYRQTKLPQSNRVVPSRPPGGTVPADLADGDPRVRLADWMTAPLNPYFARLAVNRLWNHFLGRGLVEPEDDLRSTNPATNEPLLEYLAAQLVESGYDLKAVMRLILSSRVYQLSSVPGDTNFDDAQNHSHYYVKRLPAEVLLDAICQVTDVPDEFPGMPAGTRAIELWDNRLPSYFLKTFGRSERQSPCECGKSNEPTMSQALHLMNAPEIEAKITAADGRIARLIESGANRDRIVEELCLSALGRLPGEKERKIAARLFANAPPRRAAEDFLWTILNSYDFLFVR